MPSPGLQSPYAAMFAAAQAHGNCRFCLLDLRRPVADFDLNTWFRNQFSPRLTAALNERSFTAY